MVGEFASPAWRPLVTQKLGMLLDHAECVPKRQGFPASAQVNGVGCEGPFARSRIGTGELARAATRTPPPGALRLRDGH
jgi:hypothetical protein